MDSETAKRVFGMLSAAMLPAAEAATEEVMKRLDEVLTTFEEKIPPACKADAPGRLGYYLATWQSAAFSTVADERDPIMRRVAALNLSELMGAMQYEIYRLRTLLEKNNTPSEREQPKEEPVPAQFRYPPMVPVADPTCACGYH